jgi:mannose-6-phosphate isomerase-like protein (cupin superfamily)
VSTLVHDQRRNFGVISNDVHGLGITRNLVGGTGTCRWKQLINGMHLEGGWHCVEYVVIPPGASCGHHVHANTEEIYYILSGEAVIEMNGEPMHAHAGDLVVTPIGATHSIANKGSEEMRFFVTEVYPHDHPGGDTPACIPVLQRLALREHYRNATIPVNVASVDLASRFTGDWHAFSVVDIPAGGVVGPYSLPDRGEVLFIADGGSAEVAVEGGERLVGGLGLCVFAPAHTSRRVVNTDREHSLRVISVEVALP